MVVLWKDRKSLITCLNHQTEMIMVMVIIIHPACSREAANAGRGHPDEATRSSMLDGAMRPSSSDDNELCDDNDAIQDVAKRLPMLDEAIQNGAIRPPMLDEAIKDEAIGSPMLE